VIDSPRPTWGWREFRWQPIALWVLAVALAMPLAPTLALAQDASPAAMPTDRIAAAANAFLATLTSEQRGRVLYGFNDETQRKRWSNFPTAVVPRGGLSLKEMTPAQRAAVMSLLSTVLSPRGFEKVREIMDGDEANKVYERKHPRKPGGSGGAGASRPMTSPPSGPMPTGGPPPSAGPREGATGAPGVPGPGAPPFGRGKDFAPSNLFGKDLYYISILGKPSQNDLWMLQFGGHHLALNITIGGPNGVLTPTLTGAQPAIYSLNGKTLRPLANESDKAIALLNMLDEQQRKQAILGYQVANLVLGPGEDGKSIQPEGLQVAKMTPPQRAALLDLISEWAGILNPQAAAARMQQIQADLDQTWFAWSGPTTVATGSNITAYYRIQGPRLVIEYAPQGQGEEGAMHVHTMYRDPTNDYGHGLDVK
jgi:hypothetical protein